MPSTFQIIRRDLSKPVRRWRTRRQLARLLNRPDRLDDLGLSRRDALSEALKPFWEA